MLEVSEKSSVEDAASTTQPIDPSNVDDHINLENGNTAKIPVEKSGAPPNESATAASEYPQSWKLFVIVAALCLAVFLVALDQTIVAVAVPKITDHFHSLDDVGWYVCHESARLDRSLMSTGMDLHICSPEPRYSLALGGFMLNSMCVNRVT